MTFLGVWERFRHRYLCDGNFKCQSMGFSTRVLYFLQRRVLYTSWGWMGGLCGCRIGVGTTLGGLGEGSGVARQASCAPPLTPPTFSLPFKVPDVLDSVTFLVLFFPRRDSRSGL